jgi:hypothetical protein
MFQDGHNPQQMQNINDAYANFYKQQMLMEMQQQKSNDRDWLGDLDSKMKELDKSAIDMLGGNTEFSELNAKLQSFVQSEIMGIVKIKLNSSQDVINNIKRQIEIINDTNQKVKEKERQNIEEIHDYMKNYSNMTFDDYKKLKQGIKPQNNNSENTKVLEEKHIEVETQSQNKPYKYTNHEYVRSKVEN